MRATRAGRMARPLDTRSIAEAVSHPGMDPRQWLSYGLVDEEDPVIFDDDYGPLVSVILQPSKHRVTCRVGMFAAGNGEAEYHPFVSGDEVLVAIPEGNETADCVILCRLCNSIDKFPSSSIAGQDPTTNTFGFRRTRTAYVEERSGPILFRQATSGALFSIDTAGAITLRDGQKSAFQMTADVCGYVSGDGSTLLQLDLTGKRFTLQVVDAQLILAGTGADPDVSILNVPGALSIATSAQPAAEHVLTTEAMINIVAAFLPLIGASAVCASGGPFVVTPAQVGTAMVAAIQAAAVGSIETVAPGVSVALTGAFAAATPKPPASPQLKPGIGCVGLLAG